MAAGLAEDLYNENPSAGPVTITDLDGQPRWQPLWQGNPAIGVTKAGPRLACGHGCLPYLVYPRQPGRLTFSSTYRAAEHRAHIYLTPEEQARGQQARRTYGSYLLIEPTPADRKNVNRGWPSASWERLITLLQRQLTHAIVQFDHDHATRIAGLPAVASPTFRDACGLIAGARLVVCLEGGIAFACAALGVPAVVLWGGCVSAPTLAFPEHVNLVDDQPETPCGSLKPCDHCARAWARLTPEIVAAAVQRAVRQERIYGAA